MDFFCFCSLAFNIIWLSVTQNSTVEYSKYGSLVKHILPFITAPFSWLARKHYDYLKFSGGRPEFRSSAMFCLLPNVLIWLFVWNYLSRVLWKRILIIVFNNCLDLAPSLPEFRVKSFTALINSQPVSFAFCQLGYLTILYFISKMLFEYLFCGTSSLHYKSCRKLVRFRMLFWLVIV